MIATTVKLAASMSQAKTATTHMRHDAGPRSEANHPAFLHQDKTADSKPSRFAKLFERNDKQR